MIQLEPVKESFFFWTMLADAKWEEFVQKYAKIFEKYSILFTKRNIDDNTTSGQEINSSKPKDLVKDHHSYKLMTLSFKNDDEQVTYMLQQQPGLCAVINLTSITRKCIINPVYDFVEDFLSLMGYTAIFLSLKTDDNLQDLVIEKKFIAYMQLTNRRTSNDILLFYKRLKAFET